MGRSRRSSYAILDSQSFLVVFTETIWSSSVSTVASCRSPFSVCFHYFEKYRIGMPGVGHLFRRLVYIRTPRVRCKARVAASSHCPSKRSLVTFRRAEDSNESLYPHACSNDDSICETENMLELKKRAIRSSGEQSLESDTIYSKMQLTVTCFRSKHSIMFDRLSVGGWNSLSWLSIQFADCPLLNSSPTKPARSCQGLEIPTRSIASDESSMFRDIKVTPSPYAMPTCTIFNMTCLTPATSKWPYSICSSYTTISFRCRIDAFFVCKAGPHLAHTGP